MIQGVTPRYAIYFAPDPKSSLARFGASVIGYDPDGRCDVARRALSTVPPAELISATQAPRRYGFHATLVAPFYLNNASEDQLRSSVKEFGEQTRVASLGRLQVSTMSGFIALTPREAQPEVNALAVCCVEFFDRYRAPLSTQDLARRSTGALSPRQRRNLNRWGYPHVFEDFRFHMTLTESLLPDAERRFKESLAEAFRPIAAETHRIEAVSLMRQRDPASRFEVIARGKLSLEV